MECYEIFVLLFLDYGTLPIRCRHKDLNFSVQNKLLLTEGHFTALNYKEQISQEIKSP